MPRILKIDQFVNSFPSLYGLASDGSYYDVIEDFYAEALIDYVKKGETVKIDYLEPIWNKFNILKGDIIVSTKSGVYVQPQGYDTLLEIRPISFYPEGSPSFARFQENMLSKIGKDMTQKKIMDRQTRNKLLLTRGI